MLSRSWYFYLTLIIEGAALMAVELMGAKLVAPFYGSTLYVWTAILVSTVAGLTAGYYAGGRFSAKNATEKTLFAILAVSAFLVAVLPYTTRGLITATSGCGLLTGIIITSLLLLLPPTFCFGMVGPLAVKLLPAAPGVFGRKAGTVYFTSTLGGIAGTFLFGCYLVPVAGLHFCSLLTAACLGILPIAYFTGIFRHTPSDSSTQTKDNIPNQTQKSKQPQKGITGTSAQPARAVYLFAALEGTSVMAVELLSARMLAPYFGTSLFVWAVIIAFTLMGLAIGYFSGGWFSDKYPGLSTVYWALLGGAVCLLGMHITSQHLTMACIAMDPKTAAVLVSCLLVVPPLIFLGMIPVLLIRYVSHTAADAGSATGRVFTFSSAAGIIALPLIGFYVIPHFGITSPSIIIGVLVGILPCYHLIRQKKLIASVFLVAVVVSLFARKVTVSNPNVEVVYYSEGLMGQLMVADVYKTANYDSLNDRVLFLNRIGEAHINKNTGNTKWDYIYSVVCALSKLPENAHVLVLGLGGGSIPNMLYNNLKMQVDVVEIDDRITEVSQEYFSLNKNINVISDDARHYLETTTTKYDAIVVDVFHGDIAPPHVLSLECFKKAKSLLKKNGLMAVNFFGPISGNLGKPARSVYKTMIAAGLHTEIMPTPGNEESRNSILLGSAEKQSFRVTRMPLLLYGKPINIDSTFLDCSKLDIEHATVFTDDKPNLDLINIDISFLCRKSYYKITKSFWDDGIPLFE